MISNFSMMRYCVMLVNNGFLDFAVTTHHNIIQDHGSSTVAQLCTITSYERTELRTMPLTIQPGATNESRALPTLKSLGRSVEKINFAGG